MKQDIVRHLRETFPVPLSDDDLAALLADFMASLKNNSPKSCTKPKKPKV